VKSLRHALFALLLLLAQMGVLTHAVEHLRLDPDAPAGHVCALCLAAQGLDVPLVAAPAMPPLLAAGHARPCRATCLSASPAALSARARAPPRA
jgi:hypothetical protein